jgi:hypothetical protein
MFTMFKQINEKRVGKTLVKIGQNLKNGFYFIFTNDVIARSCYLYEQADKEYHEIITSLKEAKKEAKKSH